MFINGYLTYKHHFHKFRTQCGQFAALTAPSAEIFVDNILLKLNWNNFYYMYFLQNLFFPQKILQKIILLYSKKMVICNFNIQHHLAPSRAMCQKLPIFMANKMVKNWTAPKSPQLVKLADLCLFM